MLRKPTDIYFLMCESDRVRISYYILNQIPLNTLEKSLKVLPGEKFDNEKLMDFLKRTKIFEDIMALHSRSLIVNKLVQFKKCEET